MEILYYVLAGIAGGVLGGMGMGGGTLLIPLLTLILDVPQHTAQLINLAAFIPMSAAALIFHVKNGLVQWKGLLYVVVPAAAVAVLAGFLAVQASSELLQKFFGWFLAVLGTLSLVLPKKQT